MPFFNGIIKKDKPTAVRIIEYEDYTSPLFIDLTDANRQFHFVNRQNTRLISNNGASQPAQFTQEEQKRLRKQLPGPVRDKLKTNIDRRIRLDESQQQMKTCYSTQTGNAQGSLSEAAIGDIRSYFFKAIVELFCGYQDCMGEDEDGDTTFLITKFIQIRPDSYKDFYKDFF